jgi:chromate transporter
LEHGALFQSVEATFSREWARSALIETTLGPHILVLVYVSFLAAFHGAAGIDPLLAGVLSVGLTVRVTFIPSFIFVGAHWI